MSRRSILFTRDFAHFSGGHLKVFDYFEHARSHAAFEPLISFTQQSIWDETNPWLPMRDQVVDFDPGKSDILFLGGVDWRRCQLSSLDPRTPVINLIQHVRHAVPDQDVYPYLVERAIRICVSDEVEQAIVATGKVNGPVVAIQNGVSLPTIARKKTTPLWIDGIKNVVVADALATRLQAIGYSCVVLRDRVPREAYLQYLADADIAVLLPSPTEGFYLPALEAMTLCNKLVVPDCVGNRGFCFDGRTDQVRGNCFMTDYTLDSIVDGVEAAARASEKKVMSLAKNARNTLHQYSLDNERRQFHQLLDQVDELWNANV